LLTANPEVDVAAEAGDLHDLEASEEETDVLVLASVPLAQLRDELEGWRAVLVLTDEEADVTLLRAAGVQAWGVLSLSSTQEELGAAVLALSEGLWVGAPGLLHAMLRTTSRFGPTVGETLIDPLTPREEEVLHHMAEGLANKQIAAKLGISEHTVKFHLSSLYAKLNAASRTEAVKMGLQLGLISL
jgi:DNA-binding NarL/FixJ family response regulator